MFLASSLGGLKLSSLFSPGEGAAGVVYPMLALGSGAILGGAFFFSLCFSEVVSYVFGDDFFKSALLAVLFLGGALGVYLYELSSGLGAIKQRVLSVFFFRRMWLLQPVSTQGSIKSAFLGSFFFTYSVDRGYVEFIGPQGLGYFGSFLRRSFTLIEKKIVYIRVGLLFFFVFFFIFL